MKDVGNTNPEHVINDFERLAVAERKARAVEEVVNAAALPGETRVDVAVIARALFVASLPASKGKGAA